MATEISFYQLTATDMRKSLPSLLEKVLSSGKRAVLLAANESRLKEFDDMLWTFSTNRVVPHGTPSDNYKEDQPVYLTIDEENPNKADVLVVVDGQKPKFIKDFVRIIDIFNGRSENDLTAARERWKEYKTKDFTLTYWKQDDKGSWEKAA